MALKNNWSDLVDGESFVEVEPINRIAHAVIANEENILSVQNLGESIQADNESQEARINELSEDLIRFESDAVRRDSKINENEKRITNLEKGIPSDLFLTDSSIAYSKTVPQNALPYAEVKNIGGVTRKCTNLIPYPYVHTTKTINGITFTDNGDGTITAKGTATADAQFSVNAFFVKANTNYFLTGCPSGGSNTTYYLNPQGFDFDTGGGRKLYNESDFSNTVYIVIKSGTTVSNLVFKPMLNQGTTALPYEPYFEGLRSAPVTEVESVGVNLCSGTKVGAYVNSTGEYNERYTTYRCTELIPIDPTLSYAVSIKEGYIIEATHFFDASGKWIGRSPLASIPANARFVAFNIQTGGTDVHVQLERGTVATSYKPYTRNTLPIPEAVQALDGYGDGVNESVYNYIDFEKKQFVKRVGKVDMGTLNWAKYQDDGIFHARIDDGIYYGDSRLGNALCAKYRTEASVMANDLALAFGNTFIGGGVCPVVIHDRSYAGSAAGVFKTAMSGVMLYYELATPVVTDISDLIPEDNFIGVEGNGSITMINQYKYNVPSEIVFMLNEV